MGVIDNQFSFHLVSPTISEHFKVPDNQILFHLVSPTNKINFIPRNPEKKISLNLWVPDNYPSGPKPCWEDSFNEQMLGPSKWSEFWLLGTFKWSEIWLLETPNRLQFQSWKKKIKRILELLKVTFEKYLFYQSQCQLDSTQNIENHWSASRMKIGQQSNIS